VRTAPRTAEDGEQRREPIPRHMTGFGAAADSDPNRGTVPIPGVERGSGRKAILDFVGKLISSESGEAQYRPAGGWCWSPDACGCGSSPSYLTVKPASTGSVTPVM
jgi:hypothetical protein